MSAGLDVLMRVGDTEPRIASFRLGTDEPSVTVSFTLEDSTLSLTFDADRFRAFAARLKKFAETMPGRPS